MRRGAIASSPTRATGSRSSPDRMAPPRIRPSRREGTRSTGLAQLRSGAEAADRGTSRRSEEHRVAPGPRAISAGAIERGRRREPIEAVVYLCCGAQELDLELEPAAGLEPATC